MNEKILVAIGIRKKGESGFKILKDETIEAYEEGDPNFIEQAEEDLNKEETFVEYVERHQRELIQKLSNKNWKDKRKKPTVKKSLSVETNNPAIREIRTTNWVDVGE